MLLATYTCDTLIKGLLDSRIMQCCQAERLCRQRKQWYLNGIRHIEAAALSVPDVQPGVAAAVVKQITQLLIVDFQQLHLDLILTLQRHAFD